MSLHALVHDTQLGSQPLHIFLDVGIQRFKINTILAKCVQDSLFTGESGFPCRNARLRSNLGRLAIDIETPGDLSEEVARNIGNSVQRRRLEFFKASMVEDFGDAALEGRATSPL